ncbi:MAG TPA: DNA polymerase ligase N-terminal domain-containing protein [Phycisphaerae bacterium]|nr:DNA polymerase ligase N-terminal domain-containing protein [Phycisphaerae bacterium]
MARFVVQHHVFDDGDEHWDLMLEVGPVLRTWSLPRPPDIVENLPMVAQQLFDHRIEYLEIEGDIGGGRGRVAIYDQGAYQWSDLPEAPLDAVNEAAFRLDGRRLRGLFHLERIPHEGKDLWRLRRLE